MMAEIRKKALPRPGWGGGWGEGLDGGCRINSKRLCHGSTLFFHLIFFTFHFSFFILIGVYRTQAQNPLTDKSENDLERIVENSETTPDLSDCLAELMELKEHPLNLNNIKPDELQRIPFLSAVQLSRLQEYIKAYGELFSLNELYAIDGFDSLLVRQIEPYIRIGTIQEQHPLKPSQLLRYGKSRLIIRGQQVLQKQQGYMATDSMLKKNPNAGYLGSPQKYYFRYTYDYYGRLGFGISGEKDEGEQFFRGARNYGMDFYAGYLHFQQKSWLKNLVAGNFTAGFGQGLVLGSGVSLGALPGSGSSYRNNDGFRPSLSMNESSYLRGIAATVQIWKFDLSGFYSTHKRDALLITDTLADRNEFTSFRETGDHRTVSEISGKNTIRETCFGGNISFRNNFLKVGVTAFSTKWDATLSPRIYPYNQFAFRGSHNLNLGADFLVHLRHCFLFGEWGKSDNGGIAWLAGMQLFPDPRLNIALVCRNYQKDYQDLMSNAMGQNSSVANEQGLLLSFSSRITAGLGLSGFVDLYRFPWMKYRTNLISNGKECIVVLDYTPDRTVTMYLRLRTREKQINATVNADQVTKWVRNRVITLRYQLDWNVAASLLLKSRIEALWNNTEENGIRNGWLFYQDLAYKPARLPFSLTFRYALFDCDTYDERMYAYENDVLYGYAVPAYDGRGIRTYLLLNCSPFRFLEFWIRYGQTWYSDRTSVGTGLERSEGNTRSEIKVQVAFKF